MLPDDLVKLGNAFRVTESLDIEEVGVVARSGDHLTPDHLIVRDEDGAFFHVHYAQLYPTYDGCKSAHAHDIRGMLRVYRQQVAKYEAAAKRLGIDEDESDEEHDGDRADVVAATPVVDSPLVTA